MERACDSAGLDLQFELLDIETSNARLARGEFDAAKASFHAALGLADECAVLSAGSALGYGVGPLLLRRVNAPPLEDAARVLCPGAQTTASLLFQLFHGPRACEQALFSDIMPALERAEADYGVCIHEGRFTWQQRGLECVEDLGARWEQAYGCALPLGGILVRKRLGTEVARRLCLAIEASIAFARANPQRALVLMRQHAQELSDEVLWQHVDLYVNADTYCLSNAARAALARLSREARTLPTLGPTAAPLEVWGRPRALRVFHLLAREHAAALLEREQVWRPRSLAHEGFVHLSFSEQLAGTLAAHFAECERLVLLELDTSALGNQLRYESSRGGALFPHLHRELRSSDVCAHWALERSDGHWDLPREVS
jgi:1,4-dihydroxy-6-naphthoate synthase